MEMEKINDNTIRVLLENEDLNERGITVLDLLGNHKEIESFFYSILEEVDVDHEFRENEAVTFQLLPSRNGLELFISKTTAKGNKKSGSQTNGDDDAGFSLVNGQTLADYLKNGGLNILKNESEAAIKDDGDGVPGYIDDERFKRQHYVFAFSDFEDFVQLAKALKTDELGSSLYLLNQTLYLDVVFFTEQIEEAEIYDILAVLEEFGKHVSLEHDVLDERGKCLLRSSAFELARYYFK